MSIKNLFLIEEDKALLSSTYINFARAIRGQSFSEKRISTWFVKLVNKYDYEESERRELIVYLFNHSNR